MSPWIRKYKLSNQEVAQILEDFLQSKGNPLAWDGFTLGMSFEDKHLEQIRIRCVGLSQNFHRTTQMNTVTNKAVMSFAATSMNCGPKLSEFGHPLSFNLQIPARGNRAP